MIPLMFGTGLTENSRWKAQRVGKCCCTWQCPWRGSRQLHSHTRSDTRSVCSPQSKIPRGVSGTGRWLDWPAQARWWITRLKTWSSCHLKRAKFKLHQISKTRARVLSTGVCLFWPKKAKSDFLSRTTMIYRGAPRAKWNSWLTAEKSSHVMYCPAVFGHFSPAPVKPDRALRIQ